MSNKPQLIDIPTKSRKIFFYFIDECNKYYRSGHDLLLYKKIIKLHRETGNIGLLIDNKEFLRLLYETLEKWNMNQRGAKLTTFDNFSESIISFKDHMKELHKYILLCLTHQSIVKIFQLLRATFTGLNVMESKRRIVGVSKTLHFLLPDLVMPIDNKYTMTYFYGYNKYHDRPEKEFEIFRDVFDKTYHIATNLDLTKDDVAGNGWNTSIPKLIDNSIIGCNRILVDYCDQYKDDSVKEFISLLESLTDFTTNEKEVYERLLQKQKNKMDKAKRKQIEQTLLIQKAMEAGITVTDEEVEAELADREK